MDLYRLGYLYHGVFVEVVSGLSGPEAMVWLTRLYGQMAPNQKHHFWLKFQGKK